MTAFCFPPHCVDGKMQVRLCELTMPKCVRVRNKYVFMTATNKMYNES